MASAMSSSSRTASDIRGDALVLRVAPAAWRPYLRLARLDRPIGTWLLLLPCWWSIALAQGAAGAGGVRAPDLWLYLLFGVGAVVMRGAGCTVNDLLDREYDAKVARTAERPIPSGQVSPRQALAFLALLLLIGLAVLVQLSWTAIWLGVASLLLVFPYPLMKRITYWPQLWLGLTFNWGALVGWAAVTDSLGWAPLLLYLGGIFWTLGYDTIYAHMDKDDDVLIGVKSSALKLGARTRPWLVVFYAAATLLFAAALWRADLAWPAWLGLAGLALQFAWQVARLAIDDPARCLLLFRSNRWAGLLLLAGLLAVPLAQ